MSAANHQLVRDYFTALSTGGQLDDLLTPDMTAWTTTSGSAPSAQYQGGVKLLRSLFASDIDFVIDSLTAQDDRVAAEVHAQGTFHDGDTYANVYVFVFRVRDGRIASVAEHFNPAPVVEKIVPRMQAALAKPAN